MLPSVKASSIAAFDASFAAVMARLGLDQAAGYVTALSGGPDSTALALLTQRYANAAGKRHHAVIVDHGVRDGSGNEAERVQKRLRHFFREHLVRQLCCLRYKSERKPQNFRESPLLLKPPLVLGSKRKVKCKLEW